MREIAKLLLRIFREPEHNAAPGRAGLFEEPQHFSYSSLGRLRPFLWPFRLEGLGALTLTVAAVLLSLPQPLLTKYLVDEVISLKNVHLLQIIVLTLLVLVLASILVNFLQGYYFLRFQQDVIFALQERLFDRVLRLPKSFFDSKETGYLISRIGSDVFRLQTLFSSSIVLVVPNILKLAGGIVILVYLDWRLALPALSILPVMLITTYGLGSRVRKFSRAAMERAALVFRDLQQSLSGVAIIKMFATEAREQDKLRVALKDSFQANIDQSVASSVSTSLSSLLTSLGMILLVWLGAREVIRERMTLGDLVAFNAYLAFLYAPAQSLVSFGIGIQTSFAALERVFQLLQLVPEDDEDTSKPSVKSIHGTITFEHVCFSYDGQKDVLSDICFTTTPGELMALVGPSGAGKTTLMSLIIQLYKPSSGTIRLDGTDVREFNLRSVRELIGIVSQDAFLFDSTIMDNIRYARPDASEAEVYRAANLAAAHDFIQQLPDGYQTRVGERGVRLSAGQRQRLSLARTLLKEPEVLILDEPTAALDPLAEAAVKRALNEFSHGRTTFVIAHHLTTVSSADRILVLDKGRIVQSGTHDQLMASAGMYRAFCQSQLLVDASVEKPGSAVVGP